MTHFSLRSWRDRHVSAFYMRQSCVPARRIGRTLGAVKGIWASPRFGHPHSQNHILAIMVRVTGDAHITRVLGMGMPTSLWQRPGFHKFRALASLQLFLEHSLAIKVNILSVVTFRLKWGKNGQGYVILSPFNSLTHSPMNRRYRSTSLIPVITPSVLTVLDNFGPSQTSNFSRDEPNSNLGRPKLS